MRKNYGLIRQRYKKVVMINVLNLQKKITAKKIAKRIKGLNFPALEKKVANNLVNKVNKAIENGQQTVDLTDIFNCEYQIYSRGEIFPKDPVQQVLLQKIFKKVHETEDELIVKMNWWCYII